MKKGYYIYVENCGSSGVEKKIDMQIKTFAKYFDMEELLIKTTKTNLLQRAKVLFPWNSFAREYMSALNKLEFPDFVYMRKTNVDKEYLEFMRNIKIRYPKCKIIVEIPTYPYRGEMLANPYTFVMYLKEILYRDKYKEVIDRFVTYSDDSVIFEVPTIRTMNGVDVESISPIKCEREYIPNEINLVAVALLARHHGYERIIKGLYKYYASQPERRVFLHIIGEGSEKKKYQKLVKRYKLEEFVIFYGSKYGRELDELYEKMDAGLVAFGLYKEGVFKSSAIKAREYMAKGLPVILGAEDDVFPENSCVYGLLFANDTSTVEIDKIVKYLDDLYLVKGKKEICKEIREYAHQKIDNERTLQTIIDYIEK